MHIVYISREYPPAVRMGGIASYVKEIAEAMVERGHKVTVVAASDNTRNEKEEIINGVNIVRLKGGDFIVPGIENNSFKYKKLRQIYRFRSYRKRILNKLHQLEKIDIIEVPDFGAEGHFLTNIEFPVITRFHTPTLLERETGAIKKFKLNKFHDYWVGIKEIKNISNSKYASACSLSMKEWFDNYIPQFKGKSKLIYNPINLEKWKFNTINNYQENTIFYAGTIAETKGVGDLINAVKKIRDLGYPVQLKLAGKLGNYGLKLQEICKIKKNNWVSFLGHIKRNELENYYRISKVICFPSWWENLPMVCLEAMTVGNIVIGSNMGGMAEIIEDGKDGFLIEPKNIDNITKTLIKALSLSPNRVQEIRNAAYKKIIKNFSTKKIAEETEKYYIEIIKYEKNSLG